MTDELQNDERASARNTARASWELFSRGARRHADSARTWVRAEGLEALIKERDARAITAHIEREARTRKSKRARTRYTPPPRALAPIEIKARAFGKRAVRSGI